MPEPTAISDEDLTAYLDGEADDAFRTRIEAALAEGDLSERLDALRFDKPSLERDAERLLAEAPAFPEHAANETRAPQGLALAASLVLGLTLGASSLALWTPEPRLEDWRDYAAAYHALYVPETVASLSATPADKAEQLATVSAAVNRDLAGVKDDQGLEFRRAQVLGYEANPIAHLAFSTADGTPVAFCVTEVRGDASEPVFRQRQGIATVEWSDGQHQFILIAHLAERDLRAMAGRLASGA